MLYHPDLRSNAQPFILKVDTSLYQVGSSLWQLRGQSYVLISLYSRALTESQQNYSATERECIGYMYAMEKFEKYLRNREFILIGDHEPLLQLFNINYKTKNKKLLRWSIRMSAFSFRFEHHSGNSIELALEDYLSRLVAPTESRQYNGTTSANTETISGSTKSINILQVYDIQLLHVQEITESELLRGTNTTPADYKIACDSLNISKHIKLRDNIYANANIQSIIRLHENKLKFQENTELLSELSLLYNIHDNILSHKGIFHSNHQLYYLVPMDISNHYEEDHEAPTEMISTILTRSKTKAKALKSKAVQFKPLKSYLFNTTEGDVFNCGTNPLQILFDEQQRYYKDVILYLQTGNREYLENIDFNVNDIIKYVRNGNITLNFEGLLVYKSDRYIIPPKLRISLMYYYHTSPINWHRNYRQLSQVFIKRFFWAKMEEDIKIYVDQCICNVAKYPHRKSVGFRDVGPETVYIVTRPNQVVYIDLYGPLYDDNYVVVMVDAFDGYTVLQALEPVYEKDAVSILKVIIFKWVHVLGHIEQIVSDNGSNLVSHLNKLAYYVFGITSKDIFAYSPWANGKAESRMKLLTRGCLINNYYRELLGVDDIYKKLEYLDNKQAPYHDILATIGLCHNSNPAEGTGYTPNQFRMTNNITNLLDINLRIAGIRNIKRDQYIINNIVDFDKFYELLVSQQKIILKHAKQNKMRKLLKKKYKKDEKSLKSQLIYKNDYVILKSAFKGKKLNNYRYGWVVIEVISSPNKKNQYKIRNIFSKEELIVNKGRICRFHAPLLVDPRKSLENETTRIIDLNNNDKVEAIINDGK